MNKINIFKYYLENDETDRLFNKYASRIEYDTTVWCFDKYIKPNFTVLDACAGTGAYIDYLIEKECDVYVSDIHPKHVYQLGKKMNTRLDANRVFLWDVCTPPANNRKYDVVLCMGALYHTKYEQWENIFDNCCSILKGNGLFVFTYLNKAAWILKGIIKEGFNTKAINGIEMYGGGPLFFSASQSEVYDILKRKGLKIEKHIATTGVRYLIEDRINNLNAEDYEFWKLYHLKHCADSDLLGYSQYCLVVASFC